MNVISDILYWISTGLLVPVIVLLIFFFIRALLLIGSFFGEYMQNRRVNASLGARISKLTVADAPAFAASLPAGSGSLFEAYARKIAESAGDQARTDLLLSEFEIASDKNIATSKVLTKMGPILGLMGTLIPMGPALVGLAQGDIASMAYRRRPHRQRHRLLHPAGQRALGRRTRSPARIPRTGHRRRPQCRKEGRTMRKHRRRSLLNTREDSDPMSVVSNLFDVAMVFAVALMVALVSRYNMTEIFSQEDFTMVKNPGKENMEIITKEGEKINRYTPSADTDPNDSNKGRRVGVAYELDNGDIIYVPE